MSVCDYPTISEQTIADTIDELDSIIQEQYGEGSIEAVYSFASDLCGRSIDALVEHEDLAEDDVLSEEDVFETIDAVQHGFGENYTEKQMDAIYALASELTGRSVDSILEVMAGEEDDEEDE